MNIDQFIFTHCPPGQGLEPAKAGYQIKARSEAAAKYAAELTVIGTYVGNLVHSHAPESALAAQENWRRTTQKLDAVPAAILDQFPIIWVYQRLSREHYALTRACYLGLTRDTGRRTGNFLAHSVVFPPDALAPHGYNPLALQHASAFHISPDEIKPGILPGLKNFGEGVQPRFDGRCLLEAPYRNVLPLLLTGLFPSSSDKKPVVLVLADWRLGIEIVGGLLQLLPMGLRSRLTFITYQSDPKWRSSSASRESSGDSPAEHDLIVLCPRGATDRTKRPGDLPNFYVFNFVAGDFSSLEPSAYARFASACLLENNLALLERHHRLSAALGCDGDLSACSALVALVDASGGEASPGGADLARTLNILLPVVDKFARGETAFGEISAALESLVKRNALDSVRSNVRQLAHLVDGIKNTSPATAPECLQKMLAWAGFSFGEGRAQMAALLLDCSGSFRKLMLAKLMSIAGSSPFSTPADGLALANVLCESIVAVYDERGEKAVPAISHPLTALFKILPELDLAANARLWKTISRVVPSAFRDPENQEAGALLESWLSLIKPETSPDAVAFLSEWSLKAGKFQGQKLLVRLEFMVRACQTCEQPGKVADLVRSKAAECFKPEPDLALVQAQLAEAAWEIPAGDDLYADYRTTRKAIVSRENQARSQAQGGRAAQPPSSAGERKLDEQLVRVSALRVLGRDFLETLESFDERSAHLVVDWLRQDKFKNLEMGDVLCQVVASRFLPRRGPQTISAVAAFLAGSQRNRSSIGAGLLNLHAKVIRSLPIEPLSPGWQAKLLPPLDGLDADCTQRLGFLRWLCDVRDSISGPHGSFACLPAGRISWAEVVSALSSEEKAATVRFLISCLEKAGLTSASDARVFLQLFVPLNETPRSSGEVPSESALDKVTCDRIAVHLINALRTRDTFSRAAVVLSFIQCGLAEDSETAGCGWVAGAILAGFDREDKLCRRLVEEHLERRFFLPSENYTLRMRSLCKFGGLACPALASEVSPAAVSSTPRVIRGLGRLFGKGP